MPDPDRDDSSQQLAASNELRNQFIVCSQPDLYRNNPFRRLGLGVLASPREISKRCDQLKLACELDTPEGTDAFNMPVPTSVDQIRGTAQLLQDPTLRLIHEFFWFWPLSYPENNPDDEGLEALRRGDTDAALAAWTKALGRGDSLAMHNIALHFHLTAIEWEINNAEEPHTLVEHWNPVVKYWGKVLTDDLVWQRLEARLQRLANPQVNAAFASLFRESLPDMLAKISADLALESAKRILTVRAEQHAGLVLRLQPSSAAARRTLEACIDPAVRQNDARVLECRSLFERQPEAGLGAAKSLIEGCQRDLRLIHTFCREDAARFRELTQNITDAALDALVAYQRKTSDNRSCLPWLLHLVDRPSSPELSQRITSTFEVVHGNIFDEERSQQPQSVSNTALESKILRDTLLPGLDSMTFSRGASEAYRARLVNLAGGLEDRARTADRDTSLADSLHQLSLSLAPQPPRANG